MKSKLLSIYFLLIAFTSWCQVISISPNPDPESSITLTFDASLGNGELSQENAIYMHHGVVTAGPTSLDWSYVKGNWGLDDGIGKMTRIAGTSKWTLTFTPSVRSYFGVPNSIKIYRIAGVFRSADGNKKGTIPPGTYPWGQVASNFDIYINISNEDFVQVSNPTTSSGFYDKNSELPIEIEASRDADSLAIFVNSGMGFQKVATQANTKNTSYLYKVENDVTLLIKAEATFGTNKVSSTKAHQVRVKTPNIVLPLPLGAIPGINYIENDDSKVLLVLQAPRKQYVHVIGDFNGWQVNDDYLMNITPDGEYFWLELENLEAGREYVFQYQVDGNVNIGDPYCEKVADPWNDAFIEESTYPNLPNYTRTSNGIASVFQTGQTPFNWSPTESTWQAPSADHLVIYELHVRDFIGSHRYADLIDTLTYLKRLGINAIELMPLNEFEGNDSWGYNPSYFLALDKYYGPKDDLKRLIQAAHEHGIAVILDIVLNHAFGQNPMLRLYFDSNTNTPAADNPWFNKEYVGQYQWGYDFNHESQYTKDFIDRVNKYWLEEYHFDGFRFDFTKGFTNYAPNGSVDGYDASRIAILKRMADKIWAFKSDAYIILEHWSPKAEEDELGAYGMKMWRNKSYDYIPATIGNTGVGNFNISDETTHVTFYNSHDERRIAEHCLTEGLQKDGYNIKDDLVMYERVKMAAAFLYLQPGPKMIWQFDELGYDIDINFNGRTGRKPLPWGTNSLNYYNDADRYNIYKAYQGILDVRNKVTPEKMASATKIHKPSGATRRLSYKTNDGIDLVVIGNFGLQKETISGGFSKSGIWYNYFAGDSLNVQSTLAQITLEPGEWHIFTSVRLSEGMPGVVNVLQNPVTINPSLIDPTQNITIRYDATKGLTRGSNPDGLVNAGKVYLHSGVIKANEGSVSNIIGNLTDDGIGEMTEISDDIWEITLTPDLYYNISNNEEIAQIVMYFRDAENQNQGYAFKEDWITFNVLPKTSILTIEPIAFQAEDEITVTFNAGMGNKELVDATSIYMHSSVGTEQTNQPESSAWANTLGNWGQDDGIGKMTKIQGTNKWQIKLTPKQYYGLSDGQVPFWVAAVFRNADGSKKATTNPGPIPYGFVAGNLDYFVQNQILINTTEPQPSPIFIYPNPTNEGIQILGLEKDARILIYDSQGRLVFTKMIANNEWVDISMMGSGTYIYQITNDSINTNGRISKL